MPVGPDHAANAYRRAWNWDEQWSRSPDVGSTDGRPAGSAAVSRGGTVPEASARRAARVIAVVVAVAIPLLVLVGAAFIPSGTFERVAALVLLAGIPVVVTLLALGAGAPWRVMLVPVIVLDFSGLLASADLPAGQGVSMVAPFCGAALVVAALDGRELKIGLVAAWVSGSVGLWLARTSPGLSSLPNLTPAPIAVAIISFASGLGYLTLWWAADHWQAAIAQKNVALEAARVAQAAQHRASESLRAMADNSPMPTLAFDSRGTVHSWNPAAERFLGWTAAEAIGMPIEKLLDEDLRRSVRERVDRAMSGQLDLPRIARFRRKDGSVVRAEAWEGLERDADGKPAGVVVQFLDVSERESMAVRLIEAQRLEAVGQLAGGIAHDFNNSLTAIAGFASLIASGDSPDPAEDARTIQGAAERAATLTRQLLAFSRRVPLAPQLVDLRDFVKKTEPMVRSLMGETIHLHFETESGPVLVEVDPPSLEQAILNLASNARDAMPQGGELTLAVRSFPGCTRNGATEPEAHVGIVVYDTGSGIPADSIDRVFEPFFTTKPVGKGTGLGLAMVHGFVAQSGGHAVVTSPPGQGATFELHFPRAIGILSAATAHSQPLGGSETILFVEDDPAVASFGLACLRRLGYEVTPAMKGSEAVALAASREEPFDLLLTDIVIPGMSGRELAEVIHRHHPATAILYASGYSPEQVTGDAAGPEAPLLEKPYSLAQLASRVRDVLDARPAIRAAAPGDDEGPAIEQDA
jgi:PAS domain S-box-containing protein